MPTEPTEEPPEDPPTPPSTNGENDDESTPEDPPDAEDSAGLHAQDPEEQEEQEEATEEADQQPADAPATEAEPSEVEEAEAPPKTTADDAVANVDDAASPPADAPPAVTRVTEEGADHRGVSLTEADRRLDAVYGDHPHQNDGRHLNGGVPDDPMWQNHWKRVMQLSDIGHYVLPKGKAGRWFIATLAREFAGVRQRQWNFERPMLFASVILIKTPGVRRSSDIRKRIHH
jgi:hypothetical protein